MIGTRDKDPLLQTSCAEPDKICRAFASRGGSLD